MNPFVGRLYWLLHVILVNMLKVNVIVIASILLALYDASKVFNVIATF